MSERFDSTNGDVYEADGIRVEWVELGEGLSGDYDPCDPDDVELLRFDVYQQASAEELAEGYDSGFVDPATGITWVDPGDASYCTLVPVSATPEQRLALLRLLHGRVGNPPRKRLMEQASWISLEDLAGEGAR